MIGLCDGLASAGDIPCTRHVLADFLQQPGLRDTVLDGSRRLESLVKTLAGLSRAFFFERRQAASLKTAEQEQYQKKNFEGPCSLDVPPLSWRLTPNRLPHRLSASISLTSIFLVLFRPSIVARLL